MASSGERKLPAYGNHQTTKEAIAEETARPVDEVAKIYDEELSALAAEATITQYLSVIASKRVRMKLRKH